MPVTHRPPGQVVLWSRFGMDGQCSSTGRLGWEGRPRTRAAMLARMIDFGHDVRQAIEAPCWLMRRR